MTLTGYDLSSHNTPAQFAEALGLDFVIVKASEGVTYVHSGHDSWVAQTRSAGRLVGHYHYARPESNGPEAEARAFVAAAKAQPGEALVLDFEPPSILPAYPGWVAAFSDAVTAATGAPCWLYTNQSQGNALVKLAGPDLRAALYRMPLWKAYYQTAVGDLMGWPTWTCWQYTSTPIDTNKFNGDAALWRSLGVPQEDDMALTAEEITAIIDDRLKSFFHEGAPGASNGEGYDRIIQAANKSAEQSANKIATAVADENHRRSES